MSTLREGVGGRSTNAATRRSWIWGSRWVRPAASDRIACFDFFGGGVFGEVAAGSGLKGREEGGVVGVGGENEHLRLRLCAPDLSGCLDTVNLRHAQIHQNDVRSLSGDHFNGLRAVASGADEVDPIDQADQHRQAVAHDSLVVGDHDADRRLAQRGTSSTTRQPSWVGPARIVPPSRSTRSRIPCKPRPPPTPTSPASSASLAAFAFSITRLAEVSP